MTRKLSTVMILTVSLVVLSVLPFAGCSGPSQYELTLDTNIEEGGTVEGEGSYEEGETVSILATPEEGYEFIRWEQDNEEFSSDEDYQFDLDQDRHLVALFAEREEESDNGDENGDEDASSDGDEENGETEDATNGDEHGEDEGEGREDSSADSDAVWDDWNREAITELAHDSLAVYFTYLSPQEFTSQAVEDLEAGNLSIDYPGVEDFSSPEKPYRDDIDIEIIDMEASEAKVQVTAEIAYPHISEDLFDELAERIQENILTSAENQAVNLEEQFVQVVDEAELDRQTTEKELTVEKYAEEQQDQLQVTAIDHPGELFSSFDELFKEAVVDPMEALNFELQNTERFDVRDHHLTGNYAENQIEITMWPDNVLSYFIQELNLIISDDLQISVADFWEDLQSHAGYDPYLRFSPQDYFHQVEVRDTSEEAYKALMLTRPYAAATMDSVIGYIDIDNGQANLFTKVEGAGEEVSDLLWSPTGELLVYTYTLSGVGTANLEVYDIEQEALLSLNDFDVIDEEVLGQEPGVLGEIQNMEWSDDKQLILEIVPFEEEEVFDYELDLDNF